MRQIRLIIAATLVFGPMAAKADVIITVNEVGSDVVFNTSGSLDLTGATFITNAGYDDGFISGGSNWYVASGAGNAADFYALTSFDGAFGTSGAFRENPSSVFGDDFLIWGFVGDDPKQVGVQTGYVSGSAIASGMVFSGQTLVSLFLTAGVYNYGIPNDTITLRIGQDTAVPEPATLALLGISLFGMGLARRKV